MCERPLRSQGLQNGAPAMAEAMWLAKSYRRAVPQFREYERNLTISDKFTQPRSTLSWAFWSAAKWRIGAAPASQKRATRTDALAPLITDWQMVIM